MKRLFPMIAVLILLASQAGGQQPVLLIRGGIAPPPGTDVVVPGIRSAAQTVIPRYTSGTNFPAGQILGWGPQSIITGTSATDEAIVITAGYGDTLSQFQTQTAGTQPAVLQPIVRDITIAGYSTNGWDSGGAVNDNPHTVNKDDPDLYAGLRAEAMGGTLENVTLFFIPGTAAEIRRSGSLLSGSYKPFDRVKWNVSKLNIRRVFRGLWMDATDSHLSEIDVERFRNYGVRLGSYQANGSIQFARLHAYGGGYSEAGNTEAPDGVNSPALWIDGDNCHGVDCYAEGAPIGLYIKGSYAALDGFYSHTCTVANLVFAGAYGHVSKARINATVTGVHFESQYNSLTDSTIIVAGAAKAVSVTNGTNQVIRDVTIDSYGNASGVGIDADSTLTNCQIVAHIAGGAMGIDLDDAGVSRIGVGNVIWLTTSNGTTVAADLPDSWTTTHDTSEDNDVRINGVRWYAP